ncbi:uncharacterized protein LOC141590371 [Silene latifolia]|uniref:uncharacterized protein LOC141590371 n=1 Tax=Silene latifolia TaxID=37657 RepID=UPI003D786D09
MGNCLRLQAKTVKIKKRDGSILEYKASIKVEQVLSEFKGHALSDMLPVRQYLKSDIQLMAGRFYHLVPAPPTPSPKIGKKVHFSEPESTQVGETQNSSLRIKVVISRQELKEILEKGVVLLKDVVPELQTAGTEKVKTTDKCCSNDIWTPSLKCIPQVEL